MKNIYGDRHLEPSEIRSWHLTSCDSTPMGGWFFVVAPFDSIVPNYNQDSATLHGAWGVSSNGRMNWRETNKARGQFYGNKALLRSTNHPCDPSWPLLLSLSHLHTNVSQKSPQSSVVCVRSLFRLRSSINMHFHTGVIAQLLAAVGSVQNSMTIVLQVASLTLHLFLYFTHKRQSVSTPQSLSCWDQ